MQTPLRRGLSLLRQLPVRAGSPRLKGNTALTGSRSAQGNNGRRALRQATGSVAVDDELLEPWLQARAGIGAAPTTMSIPPPNPWSLTLQLARRSWLKLAATAAGLSALGVAWWGWLAHHQPESVAALEAAMLERIVDILVPRDETPGALDLGVHHAVQQALQVHTPLSLACSELFQTLDRNARTRHRKAFLDLPLPQQDALLQAVAQAGHGSAGWPALMQLRERTLALYYAQPKSWPALGLAGAPQPIGFMDYTEAPKPRA